MGFKFDQDGLKIEQSCSNPGQKNWADWLDNLAQDVRDGKMSITTLQHHLGNKTIVIYYTGETTK